MVAFSGEDDDAHRLVATGGVDGVRDGRDHVVVKGVALGRLVDVDAQSTGRGRDAQMLGRAHDRSNLAAIASSAPWRSVAPPGGSGNRTGPRSRLGRRIVACPGVVSSPRWLSARRSTSTAGRSPSSRYTRVTVPRSHCVSPT